MRGKEGKEPYPNRITYTPRWAHFGRMAIDFNYFASEKSAWLFGLVCVCSAHDVIRCVKEVRLQRWPGVRGLKGRELSLVFGWPDRRKPLKVFTWQQLLLHLFIRKQFVKFNFQHSWFLNGSAGERVQWNLLLICTEMSLLNFKLDFW